MTRKEMFAKRAKAQRRSIRTRAIIRGTAERPRLSVFRSSKHITVQLIDDTAGKTLASAIDVKMKDAKGKKPLEMATLVGGSIADSAKKAGISRVVFDRGSYRYHGRVKAVADAARAGGLEF